MSFTLLGEAGEEAAEQNTGTGGESPEGSKEEVSLERLCRRRRRRHGAAVNTARAKALW